MKALVLARNNSLWSQICQWLDQMGWTIEQSVSYRSAVQMIKADTEIDLVLVDSAGVDSGSLTFINAMRSDHRLESIPVMVGATAISPETVNNYLSLGIENILLLPTSKETFQAKVSQAVENGRPRVLVVDDETAIRELLTDFLLVERYQPMAASCFEEAIETMSTARVDVVVTDIMLGTKSGLDLLAHIKQTHPGTPVILITGNAGQYTPDKVMSLGAHGYFAKPFHNVELIYTLRKVLRNRPKRQAVAATTL